MKRSNNVGRASGSAGCASLSRRAFVAGSGIAALAGVSAAPALAAGGDSEAFDCSYDVVVIGFGLAGASSAVFAADAGAKVLLVDAVPMGHEGGNSRYCAQICITGKSYEGLLSYYTALGGEMEQDPEVLEAYCSGMMDTPDIMRRMGSESPVVWSEYVKTAPDDDVIKRSMHLVVPEYPEMPGPDQVDIVTWHAGTFDASLYLGAHDAVDACENIEVWYASPGKKLIWDPQAKAVVGAVVEREGAEVRVGAGAVVLACGGFECNKQMIQDYLGKPRLAPLGGLYNKGDGIRMAQEIGADLWHMHNYESVGMLAGNQFAVPEGERAIYISHAKFLAAAQDAALVCVGTDGSRFMREDEYDRHGHVNTHGTWHVPHYCSNPHMVFDEAQKAVFEQRGLVPPNYDEALVEADGAEALAELIGADPEILARTVERFSKYAVDGEDLEFGRAPQTMRPFEGDKIYALPLQPCVLNTQGGPRRNARAQVIGIDGNPIAGLFSAGECGGVNTYCYNGGGNMAECLVFGRIAGTNAALGIE